MTRPELPESSRLATGGPYHDWRTTSCRPKSPIVQLGLALSLAAVPLLAMWSVLPVLGQTRTPGDSGTERAEWFRALKTPAGQSCCDLGDCRQVHAEWRSDTQGWWAAVNGKWRPVPAGKVLNSPPSIDGAAYLCVGTEAPVGSDVTQQVTTMLPPIFCFVPPDTGS